MLATLIALAIGVPRSQAVSDSVWFRRSVARYDLTGDGKPETLTLIAHGSRVDSLRIEFTIRSAGKTVYDDSWLSTSYFQYDDPIDSIPEPVKRRRVFDELRKFLRAGNFEPLDRSDAQNPGPTDAVETIAFSISFD